MPRAVVLVLVLLTGACVDPDPPPTPALAPSPTPAPTPFPANASCGRCPALPCTRECLPALTSGAPVLRTYSAGTCPPLVRGLNPGFGYTVRPFLLYVPTRTRGPFGLVFFWGVAGPPEGYDFLNIRYEQDGYILVIPDGKKYFPYTWAMDERGLDDDLRYYDDVVACVSAQFPVDRRRVHTTGYSTGAVFSAYLMGRRSDSLASFAGWSVGESDPSGHRIVPDPPRPLPGLLNHGGPADGPDWAGRKGTLALAAHMRANGALAIVCNHGLGHVVPGPIDATLSETWAFMLAHPFGQESTWAGAEAARHIPDWCTNS